MTAFWKRDRTTRGWAALATALVLAAAGCGSGDAPAGGTPDGPAATRTTWPQPVGGRLTTDMCDLLGPADYSAAGATAAVFNERKLMPRKDPTFLSCHSVGENWLTLNLQPGAVSGGIYYDWRLRQHRKKAGKSAELRENVVPGVDASYYDAEDGGHQLVVRRGALIVTLEMGFMNDGIDQFAATTKLVGLVLRRTRAGTTETGEPHHLILTVTGRPARFGPVDIQYFDPNTLEAVKERADALPWIKKLDFAWYGDFSPSISVDALPARPGLNKYLSCAVHIDGKKVDESLQPGSSASCRGSAAE
ncbi:hypothetical protein [Actinoplanes sp. NPDC049265]|uniref:hypothetical protein n=1 Tax=Actinoplanes sp. NPDC049265 TaxID=3363902 RepID=UPI0037134962